MELDDVLLLVPYLCLCSYCLFISGGFASFVILASISSGPTVLWPDVLFKGRGRSMGKKRIETEKKLEWSRRLLRVRKWPISMLFLLGVGVGEREPSVHFLFLPRRVCCGWSCDTAPFSVSSLPVGFHTHSYTKIPMRTLRLAFFFTSPT